MPTLGECVPIEPTKDYTATQYDVAISFCRSERSIAKQLARYLRATGISVYFDEWNESETVGRSLNDELTSIYLTRCRHCIVLASENYLRGHWPQMEWAAIYSRVMDSDMTF